MTDFDDVIGDMPILPCTLCRRVPERDCRVRHWGRCSGGGTAHASICDDYRGEEPFDRRAWDLDIPGSEYLWHDPQVRRDAFALLETIDLPDGGTS